jgi:hypothetical protein
VLSLDPNDLIFDLLVLFLDDPDVLRILMYRLFHHLGVLLDIRQLQLHRHLNHLIQAPCRLCALCAAVIPLKCTPWDSLRGVRMVCGDSTLVQL